MGISGDSQVTVTRAAEGLTLRDVVNVLFRRKWVILAIALPIIIIGSLSLFGETGSYTAASRVVVELVKVDLPVWNTSGRNVDYDRELSTLFNIAMSVPVGDQAAQSLQDSIPMMQELDVNLVDLHRPGRLAEFLRNGLDVSVVGESSILEFQFSSANPQISLMAVGAMRDAFVRFQVHGRKNVKAVAFYAEQLNVVRAEIDSLLGIRGGVLEAGGYSSLEDELRYDSGQLANTESKMSAVVVTRRALEAQFDQLSAYLSQDPRDFPMGPDENRSLMLVHWMTQLAKQETELSSILTIHTDESSPARRQRELIRNTIKSLAQEERNYIAGLSVNLESVQAKELALGELVVEIQKKNSRAPAIYQQVSLIDAEIESLRGLLEDLQVKHGEVRLNQLADERVSSVVVLSDPEMIAVLSGSKTIVYVVLIFVFAIALGVVAAFIIENLDHRVYVPSDIEDNLKLPVFASVTKVE